MDNPKRVIVDRGPVKRPGKVASVASVFGEPYQADGKTLIPVAQVRFFITGRSRNRSARDKGMDGSLSSVKPVAVIEVAESQVRIVRVPDPLPIIIGGMLVGAWNIYWILRTVREVRARRG